MVERFELKRSCKWKMCKLESEEERGGGLESGVKGRLVNGEEPTGQAESWRGGIREW